jgi:cell division protein FtsI/penicillin-binding protein 2
MKFSISRPTRIKKNTSESIYQLNSNIVLVGIIIFVIGIVLQMGRWQILNKEKFVALAQSQYLDDQRQPSSRGIIYAADGSVLATDQPSWNIYASLSSLESEREDFFAGKDKYIATVSGILEIDKEVLDEKLPEDFRYVKLATNVDQEVKKALETTPIFKERYSGFGFYFEKSEKRIYPNGELASHILGFIGKNDDGSDKGLYGIEGYYFGDLIGTEGFTYEEHDAKGNVILTAEYDPVLPRQGRDITLTIIPGIQKKVEEELKKGVEQHQAKSGSVIIMNPNTGAIISMANYPTFDGNEYWRTQDPWIFKNKAVADVYEPGSIFKPITVAIGLETGAITEETQCDDSTGYLKIFEGTPDEKTIYTWDRKPDGIITPEDYLRHSNNPCIARTALAVGHEAYYPKIKEFGIGEFIGMGLQDEANSYLLPYEYWTKLDLAVTSFGQSVSTTPLQILSALSTIANDGKRMKPYVVASVGDDEEEIRFTPTVLNQPISAEVAHSTASMMRSVVEKGDARFPFKEIIKTYDVAGKTGTAQIPKKTEAGYYTDRTNTTFVGFAPVDNPVFIMLVRLEEPGLDQYASSTAVPVWANIFKAIADDLEVPKK